MSCLIPLTAVMCLLNPANVSVEAGLSTQVGGGIDYWWAQKNYQGGKFGRLALRLDQPLTKRISYYALVEHRSMVDVGDRGEERFEYGLIWRPFAR